MFPFNPVLPLYVVTIKCIRKTTLYKHLSRKIKKREQRKARGETEFRHEVKKETRPTGAILPLVQQHSYLCFPTL